MSSDGGREAAEVLGGRYAIERELGRGGMATVYLARDVDRGGQVAVKVMDPRLASVVGAGRFAREISIARSMAHPLIVPLLDSGEADGRLYYVMPFIDGESLYKRLRRERRLGVEEALRVTHDIAEALTYAHARGVLHRDLKPENILLRGGRALVADFGLARIVGAADSQKLTATGVIVGTVSYMCPEQLREDLDLDVRVDVYSLGCVLYEILTGEPPYAGVTLTDVVARILNAPVPSVLRLRPEVPAAVERVIGRALAKSRDERLATMTEFAAALDRC